MYLAKKTTFGEWVKYGIFAPIRPKKLRTGLTIVSYVAQAYCLYKAYQESKKLNK